MRNWVAGVVLLGLLIYPVINPWQPYPQGVMLMMFLLAIQATSWNIISGYAGYISLGHSMFLGLGSYTAAIVALHTGVNPLWVAPLGGVTAVVVAVVFGAVVLRTRGHAFVIITIALLLSAQIVATNWDSLTNGSDGITLELPFWSSDFQNIPFYYAFLLLLVLTVLFSAWLARTKLGTGLVAIREDEGKAAAIGVNTTAFKIIAYGASSFFIGVAGGVYAYYQTFLNPVGAFAILGSVLIVLSALVGGRGTLYGPVIGAFLVALVNEGATVYGGSSQTRVLIMGLILVLVVLFLPAGLLPTLSAAWHRRHPAEVPFTDQAGTLSPTPALSPRNLHAPASSPHDTHVPDSSSRDLQATSASPQDAHATTPSPRDAHATASHPLDAHATAPPPRHLHGTAPSPRDTHATAPSPRDTHATASSPRHLHATTPPSRDISYKGPILEVRGASKRFGGLVAVDGADLTVERGSITALIGPNGSGKTTLFNLITGTMPADAGRILLDGKPIEKLPPWSRAHLGLGRTFQITRLFKDMTVVQNVVAPQPDGKVRTMLADAVSGVEADRARELLSLVGLGAFASQKAGSLSYGQQKLVELAQVLMLSPELILLDEPAGGVNPSLLGKLTEVIRSLNRSGVTFLVVEHNIPLVLDLCDPVHVFARGRCIASGPPAEIRSDPLVLDAYLGDDWRPADAHA